jgi:hypothetical protein
VPIPGLPQGTWMFTFPLVTDSLYNLQANNDPFPAENAEHDKVTANFQNCPPPPPP